MVWLIQMYEIALHSFYDITWRAVTIAEWTMIEVNAAIVCGCLTTLRPLLTRLCPRIMSSQANLSHEPENPPDMIAGYERPLTVGTRPNRLNVASNSDNSSLVSNEMELLNAESESGGHCAKSDTGERKQVKKSQDLESQTVGDSMREVEIKDFRRPPKSHIRTAESHDSLRRYSSTPVSQHRGF